ncbi:hypothetical protein HG531_011775 [Fusarium graminearum]|nr:hypothetical protein HG531_011775 [Fusarium graminearum]
MHRAKKRTLSIGGVPQDPVTYVHNVPAATLYALASIRDENGQFGVLIENLLDATIVAARLALWASILCQILIVIIAVVMNYAMVVFIVAVGGWRLRGFEALIWRYIVSIQGRIRVANDN